MAIERERVRHELVRRRAVVSRVAEVAPGMVRVTLAGDELTGFTALGPADHVKVFLPATDAFAEASRDFTPLEFRPEALELDLDVVLHGDAGPATAWAARARAGDELAIGGPRGSLLFPTGIRRLVLAGDATAFPAMARWLRLAPSEVGVTVVATPPGRAYFTEAGARAGFAEAAVVLVEDATGLTEGIRALGGFDDATFVFAAGEANSLIPLRRYLRDELSLAPEQWQVAGYWRAGVAGLDHHAPLDPDEG